ncbi:CoA-transferase family III domain-containing protein [Phellopilus nigrolimitatus]|nr:CoA-transferase family III domain-containing protein [Phellopilus nigrolimitatus]
MLPGTAEKPSFPLNILADFAGGGLTCALGILLALQSRNATGKGRVVETDMVSGVRYLSSFPLLHYQVPNSPFFGDSEKENGRGTNILDGGAPFYNVYTCADGRWMSVGCLEPQFYRAFIEKFIGALPQAFLGEQGDWRPTEAMRTDESKWPRLRAFLEFGFRTRTRDEWAKIFHGTDACAVPVLSPTEAAQAAGSTIPTPHPMLAGSSQRPSNSVGSGSLNPGEHTKEILKEMDLPGDELAALVRSGALGNIRTKL